MSGGNAVTVVVMQLDVFSGNQDDLLVRASCSKCGIDHEYRGRVEGETPLDYVRRVLAAQGCVHVDDPFEDDGAFFDPRTEVSRSIDHGDMTGTVEGFIPIQGRGRIGDLHWYYRDRDGSQFGVSELDADDAVRWAFTGDLDPGVRGRGWGMPWAYAQADSIPEAVAAILHAYDYWERQGRPLIDPGIRPKESAPPQAVPPTTAADGH